MNPNDSISDVNPSQHLTGEELQSIPLKRRKLDAGLYIVATPIGNLGDITLRAIETLHSVDHILAEDTRQTRKLLDAYNIKTSISAYHDHNAAKRVSKLIESLKTGQRLALVSDAGTPLISDPGFKLVRAAVEAEINIFPLPGASAVLAGLVKSGLPSDKFMFAGFLPPKSAARKTALKDFISLKATVILFETGPRIKACLEDIANILGDRKIVLIRELTKRYEEARHGTIQTLLNSVIETPPKGEIVLLISPDVNGGVWTEADVLEALKTQISESGVKRASADIAAQSKWAKRDVYQLALSMKSKLIKPDENKD